MLAGGTTSHERTQKYLDFSMSQNIVEANIDFLNQKSFFLMLETD